MHFEKDGSMKNGEILKLITTILRLDKELDKTTKENPSRKKDTLLVSENCTFGKKQNLTLKTNF